MVDGNDEEVGLRRNQTRTQVLPRWCSAGRGACALLLYCATACSGDPAVLAGGATTDWSNWNGRWLVINYWAEWCAPCRHEIPELNELHDDRAATGHVVLGVNFDGVRDDALAELAVEMGIEFPVLNEDPQPRFGYAAPTVLPSTYLIAPDGTVRGVLVGPQTRASIEAELTSTP